MFLSDLAIKRPTVTVVTMLALVIFGIFALWSLKVDEFPDVAEPVIAVSIVYPGASPEGVERELLDPIEEAISGASGIDKMQSTAQDGFAQIIVFWHFDKDLNEASQDIRDAISKIRDDLPPEMKEPVLSSFDPGEMPIVSVILSSPSLAASELTAVADPEMVKQLRAVAGVADVRLQGKVEREMTVELEPQKLDAAGVTVADVVRAMEAQNLAAPVGRVNDALSERTIRLKGRLADATDFDQVVVARRDARLIRLADVGRAKDSAEEPRTLALFDGRQAIGLDVVKAKGYSTADVATRVKAKVEELRATLPSGVELSLVRDAGERVERSVGDVEMALIEGALLTVLVVFLFLNSWRSTVITGLALPVSVIAAFVAVWAFGFTLNSMSLMGLSLAIGILIDDAIVVRENIVRHVHQGKDHHTAAREGTAEIGLAVAATTFSIVAVFVPIAFMNGVAGQWFKPFALTIACSVLVSLFVSFSLDPMLSAYWPDPDKAEHEKGWITRLLDRFNHWFNGLAERYQRVVGWALDHRAATMAIAAAAFFGAIFVQYQWGGAGFMPVSDNSELNMLVETEPGSSLDYTRLKAEEAARIARGYPEVRYTYTTIGGSSGAVDSASVYVKLVPKAERERSQEAVGQQLRGDVSRLAGATTSVFTGWMNANFKQIQIELRGKDSAELTRLAEQMLPLAKKVPGAVDVGLSTRGQKPELEVELQRGLASSLGLSVGEVAQSMYPAFAGLDAGDWVDPTGETRDVVVRLAPEARRRAADLARLPLSVQGPNGPTSVPLGQVATIREGLGPATVQHLDSDRSVIIQANVSGRSFNEVKDGIRRAIDSVPLPLGTRITEGGEAKDQAEVFGKIFAALGIAVVLMYLILVMQFGSFLDPVAIMLSLPLSLIGVVLALIITGDTLNIMSLIGVILLCGIVAKNAILLIDFAKWGRERGMSRREAIIEAGRIRLRPILMTTFALIAGMVPIALGRGEGADWRAPLGRAVIGGTLTSTLLTLLVIPTVYEILDEWKEGALAFVKRRRKGHAEEPTAEEVEEAARQLVPAGVGE
jgi:hydrophobic/amphiphilic exporter-1 (mainly G- bacteria), HAE1 family